MGLNVYVYRHPLGDCTNGGISSKAKQLCIVNIEGPFDPKDDAPAALLVANPFGSVVFKPAILIDGEWQVDPNAMYMMGGNYATASDSRFGAALAKMGTHNSYVAIPIHDRQE